MLLNSSVGQCLSVRLRRHHHRLDVCRHQLRLQRCQQRSLADDVVFGHKHSLPAPLRSVLRHVRAEDMFLRLDVRFHGRMLRVLHLSEYARARHHEGRDGFRRRRADHNG